MPLGNVLTNKMPQTGKVFYTSDDVAIAVRLRSDHSPHSLRPERPRPLTRPIRLHLELLVFVHHIDEPLVWLMGCGEAVGRREPERHLSGW